MRTAQVLSYPVHIGTLPALVEDAISLCKQGQHCHVVTINPEMLMRGETEPEFGAILKTADVVLPDGAGVVWALKQDHPDVIRVPGIEFSEALLHRAVQEDWSIALIGASAEVNEAACQQLTKRIAGLKIAYAHHGYLPTEADREAVAQACAAQHPKVVLVALGVPGQEVWIRTYQSLFTESAIFVGVGGSFDVWSGFKQRAPDLFLKLNLEWLYRITSEPFRLKRVYKTLPGFVLKVLWSRLQPAPPST